MMTMWLARDLDGKKMYWIFFRKPTLENGAWGEDPDSPEYPVGPFTWIPDECISSETCLVPGGLIEIELRRKNV